MIAADSSSLIAYLSGEDGPDVEAIDSAIAAGALHLPPVVVTELLSDFKNRTVLEGSIAQAPMLEILPDYWRRAGAMRALLLSKGLAVKIPDTLIAQSCIDHAVPLIQRDAGFHHFAKHCGLKLA